jgi:hypothetical protein
MKCSSFLWNASIFGVRLPSILYQIWINMEAMQCRFEAIQGVSHSVSSTPVTANCRFCFNFGRKKRPAASVTGKKEMQTAILSPAKPPCGQISLSSTSRVDDLEREFRTCKSTAHSESSLSDQLAKHGPTTGFDDAWRPVD